MPTYTYKCISCGHQYEKLQKITSQPDTTCPECNGEVERLIGAGVGIVFKGTGFYVTDYKNKNNSNNPKKETAKTSESTKNSEAS
ncbi:MAG: FmdB family zinc ribbon protein [Leptonema sp. (in: bacteria)]